MAASPSPADATRLRVAHRVRCDFLAERNVIRDDETSSRKTVRKAILRLTPAERKELTRRLRERRRELTELMDGDQHRFEQPRATQDDLANAVNWAWRNQ